MLFVTLFEGAFDFVPHAFGCRMPMSGDEQQCENYGPKRSQQHRSLFPMLSASLAQAVVNGLEGSVA